ncbi:DNA-processing protein DprA [Mycetocola zhujimingii]|uniref:DNA-protecting protein DprA n=1 Tax=Mycetocola zhujimingii TaxID=2079792 RepID=A0A2U1THB5_9MICO|nr:DNA-processing protein DprA [Mycetocola zhujimingii]PWC08268.1 DNA-protecting protein DprA [Mycetocola zhujimingii]
MRVFELDADDVSRAIFSVTPQAVVDAAHDSGATAEVAAERFARAVWTGIVEPGDGAAGSLIEAIGASAALRSLVERWSPNRVSEALGDQSDGDLFEHVQKAWPRWIPRLDSAAALASLRLAKHNSATLICPGDDCWPTGLNDLGPHAPLALWVRGDPWRLPAASPSISLVGARAATGYGEHVTLEAASALVDRGFTIISGAAYGIDGAAHRAALASQGTTVAFLAGGVDRPYPSGHDALIGRIVETGAVASEVPCGVPPSKWRFLQRNRLIAAVSSATVVLEAGWRSGSLNTAGHAAALGRPLGAVPGPVTSAASAGCHRLIREYGATCVTNADEMAELAGEGDLGAGMSGGVPSRETERSSDEVRVLDSLSTRSGRNVDDIARRAGLPVDAVQSVLGVLELEGVVGERQLGWVYLPQRR